MAQIFSITAKPITIFEAYKDFEDMFSTKNTSHLSVHEDYNHIIDLINNKQSSYGPIYS